MAESYLEKSFDLHFKDLVKSYNNIVFLNLLSRTNPREDLLNQQFYKLYDKF